MSEEIQDGYSDAVAYFKRCPDQILSAWGNPLREPGGFLFRAVTPTGNPTDYAAVRDDGKFCGCLTYVRNGTLMRLQRAVAWTDQLTEAIRADERLPCLPPDIGPGNLDVFAEWNRRIDKELGRTPPARMAVIP